MTSPVASRALLESGLSLFHEAGGRALASAARLSSVEPEAWLDGTLGLIAAERASHIAAKVVQTAQELDDALLDILA